MVQNAREFILAIKESTSVEYDADAAEFLELLRVHMTRQADIAGFSGERRDGIFFFDGMLRGVQLNLTRQKIELKARLQEMGLWGPDGVKPQ